MQKKKVKWWYILIGLVGLVLLPLVIVFMGIGLAALGIGAIGVGFIALKNPKWIPDQLWNIKLESLKKYPAMSIVAGLVSFVFGVLMLTFFTQVTETKQAQSPPAKPQQKVVMQQKSETKKQEENLAAQPNRISAQVEEVIDGDTIKVSLNGKSETVRFILVDTPETKHPQKGKQPFGPEAYNFTKSLLEGKTVELEKDVQERDKYGRLLMYVYVDGKMVQEELLKKGLARVAVFPPNVKYVDQFRKLENEAKQQGIGIWSIENYVRDDGFYPPEKKESKPPAPQPETQPEPKSSLRYDPNGPDRDCSDFSSQEEAQEFFEAAGPGDPHRLDRDHDGIACESN
jgi:micrococcal nuclease